MKHSIVALLLAGASINAHATAYLEDRGDWSWDPLSGLEWLDTNFTFQRSFADVSYDLGQTGSSLYGWRYATVTEFSGMFTSRGYEFSTSGIFGKDYRTKTYSGDDFFDHLIRLMDSSASNPTSKVTYGMLADSYPGTKEHYMGGIWSLTDMTKANAEYRRGPLNSDPGANGDLVSSFLVRNAPVSSVPEPGTLATMLTGLAMLGFVGARRKR